MVPKSVSPNRIRIVIADDHTVLRESLAALLSTQSDFIVEGRASNGQEALAIVHEHPPDVLLLDLFMPEGDGFEVLRTLDRAGSRVAAPMPAWAMTARRTSWCFSAASRLAPGWVIPGSARGMHGQNTRAALRPRAGFQRWPMTRKETGLFSTAATAAA